MTDHHDGGLLAGVLAIIGVSFAVGGVVGFLVGLAVS